MIIKDKAIILHSFDYGESSKIIHAFTREFGRISLIGKGIRSPKSKLHFISQPLSCVEITYYDKNKDSLHLLSTAANILTLNKIFTSLEHLTCGMMIIESIHQSIGEKIPYPELFEYTVNSIVKLNQLCFFPFNYFVANQFKLAESLGFWLQLDFMLDESDKNTGSLAFSIADGAPVQLNSNEKNKFIFDFQTALYLQKIFRFPFDQIDTVPANKSSINKVVVFFEKYFSFHLEKNFIYSYYSLLQS